MTHKVDCVVTIKKVKMILVYRVIFINKILISLLNSFKTYLFGSGDNNAIQSIINIRIGRKKYPDTWNQNNERR